jgi:hypothetical protein
MADTIVDGTTFNAEQTMYTNPKANDKGGKSINILNKKTKTGLRLSTPLMLTWGASEYVDPEGRGNGKYEMSLQFPQDEYSNDDCRNFLENMQALESKVKEDAFKNSKEWFGKAHKNSDIIDELFTPMLKYPKIKGTSESDFSKKPTIRLKLPQWDGSWKSEVYDEEGNTLFPNKDNVTITPLDFLRKGAMVACIIQCGGIWFTNGKFTLTWKLMQVVVQKPRETITGHCFIKLKEADKVKLASSAPVDDSEDPITNSAIIDDSDDEEVSQTLAETQLPVKEDYIMKNSKNVEDEVTQIVAEELTEIVTEELKPKKKVVKKKVVASSS